MIKSIFLIFSVFISTVAIAENNRSFDDALHAFYIGDDIKAKAGFILAAEQGSIEAEYYLGLIEKKQTFLQRCLISQLLPDITMLSLCGS